MDQQNNNGILGELGTINASGTVSIDSNSIVEIIAGVAFLAVLIIGGIFILGRLPKSK